MHSICCLYLNVTSGTEHLTPLWKGCLREMVWLLWSTEDTSPWYTPSVGPQLMDTKLPNQSAAISYNHKICGSERRTYNGSRVVLSV